MTHILAGVLAYLMGNLALALLHNEATGEGYGPSLLLMLMVTGFLGVFGSLIIFAIMGIPA